jgi:hypothetical protein
MTDQTVPKRPETNEEWSAQFLREGIQKVAANLRDLADRVERATHAVDGVGRPGRPNYGSAAGEVSHTLAWGFANLNVEQLVRYATDADVARAKGE